MKKLLLLLPLLVGCEGFIIPTPVRQIAIKVATAYCEPNKGVEWIQSTQQREKYFVQFRCNNGLQSDWQEMNDEKKEKEKEVMLK